jgi:pimeloyl-ACP methyl ester carboxylesterase
VRRIRAPISVVFGASDSVVPAQQSREVATIARARSVEVPGADHNDPALLNGTQLIDAVVDLTE